MKSIYLLFLFLIVTTLIADDAHDHDSLPRKVALIATIHLPKDRCLIRYNFIDGALLSIDTLFATSGPGQRFGVHKSQSCIYHNRYAITGFGDIVDLKTGQFIYRPGSKLGLTRLRQIDGDSVIFYSRETKEYHYFDLSKREYHPIVNPVKWLLPGTLSPDGTMSISSSMKHEGIIWLHRINGDTIQLGKGFHVKGSPFASWVYCSPPFLWLDNQRILTQKSNGNIVIVDTNGSTIPIVNIDLTKIDYDLFGPLGGGATRVSLEKNAGGSIIYTINLMGPNKGLRDNQFLIDVENKSYTMIDPEWTDLGNTFGSYSHGDTSEIRYREQIIGQEPYFNRYHAQTINGYIAITGYISQFLYPNSIKVWNSINENWTTIKFESPTWLSHDAIIGWLEVE